MIFGADDGRLYALDRTGQTVWSFEARGKIRTPARASDSRIVFGTEDGWIYCLNPLSGKKKWAFKLGGRPLSSPITIGKRIVIVASNSTCYCLSSKNGEIVWWKAVPSRILFEPVIAGDRILLSSASPEVTVLELATGEVLGSDRFEETLSAGVLWLNPDVFAVIREPGKEEEKGIFLRKEVKLSVTSSRTSPQRVGEAIEFQAAAVGFFRPKFVFAISDNDERRVLRSENTEDSWIWFPEKPGSYRIHVRAFDEKQTREAEISFVIEKRSRQYL
jgi:hypothetical protein